MVKCTYYAVFGKKKMNYINKLLYPGIYEGDKNNEEPS